MQFARHLDDGHEPGDCALVKREPQPLRVRTAPLSVAAWKPPLGGRWAVGGGSSVYSVSFIESGFRGFQGFQATCEGQRRWPTAPCLRGLRLAVAMTATAGGPGKRGSASVGP